MNESTPSDNMLMLWHWQWTSALAAPPDVTLRLRWGHAVYCRPAQEKPGRNRRHRDATTVDQPHYDNGAYFGSRLNVSLQHAPMAAAFSHPPPPSTGMPAFPTCRDKH